jgi:hypothetical protein
MFVRTRNLKLETFFLRVLCASVVKSLPSPLMDQIGD